MNGIQKMKIKWQNYLRTHRPQIEKTKKTFQRIGTTLRTTGVWLYKLRSVVLAIPVAIAAILLAIRNLSALPESVGFDMQASGEYAMLLDRSVVVVVPLAVTALCLLLTFCSRKVLYPWLISVFSLALPVLFYLTSVFPG